METNVVVATCNEIIFMFQYEVTFFLINMPLIFPLGTCAVFL